MDTLHRLSDNCTELSDRTLWFDGDSTIPSKNVTQFVLSHGPLSNLCVDELTDEIKKYNTLVNKGQQIVVKEELREFDYSWNIPEQFKNLDVKEYVTEKLYQEFSDNCWLEEDNEKELSIRTTRVLQELQEYTHLGLNEVLRTIIYIINTLEDKEIVWGVGRGSSVSSYVLYLIGVHDVDSVEFDLDFRDFLRAQD